MRELNIQNIAHISYYTNANGLLLVVLIKRGSAKFSLTVLGSLRGVTYSHQGRLLILADARDQAASYAARVRSMSPPVVATGRDADRHCYVVLGGATRHWAIALLKRFLGLNCFEAGFELFWIQMPGSRTVLQQLSAFAGAAHEGHPRPLKPKIDTKAEFSEAAARRAFDALRGRRTAGKIVMEVVPPGAGGAGGNV